MTSWHARAPVRLDLAGGWTDVAPFTDRHDGVVVNAAIGLHANATITPGGDAYVLHADDLGERLELTGANALVGDGELGLLRAALRASHTGPCELRTRGEAPAGSGLGSSGALGVALVAAIDASQGIIRSADETAERAWHVETEGAAVAGGRQDQWAAAHGGFAALTFRGDTVQRRGLVLDDAFREALASHLVVCYTGRSRFSSDTITRVMHAFERGDQRVTGALHELVAIAHEMIEALGRGDLAATGRLLSTNWSAQQRLDPAMCTPEMRALEAAMGDAGMLGGKAAGSGAGGSMFFLVTDVARARNLAREAGARVLDAPWADEGVRVARLAVTR